MQRSEVVLSDEEPQFWPEKARTAKGANATKFVLIPLSREGGTVWVLSVDSSYPMANRKSSKFARRPWQEGPNRKSVSNMNKDIVEEDIRADESLFQLSRMYGMVYIYS